MTHPDLNLMVCLDGGEIATVPLKDGDDRFNAEAERGALDRAYEAKESNPEALVTIVLAWHPDDPDPSLHDEIDGTLTRGEWLRIGDALDTLAGIDEGENTDLDDLIGLRNRIDEVAGLGLREAIAAITSKPQPSTIYTANVLASVLHHEMPVGAKPLVWTGDLLVMYGDADGVCCLVRATSRDGAEQIIADAFRPQPFDREATIDDLDECADQNAAHALFAASTAST